MSNRLLGATPQWQGENRPTLASRFSIRIFQPGLRPFEWADEGFTHPINHSIPARVQRSDLWPIVLESAFSFAVLVSALPSLINFGARIVLCAFTRPALAFAICVRSSAGSVVRNSKIRHLNSNITDVGGTLPT
jgi:hypothetical protein